MIPHLTLETVFLDRKIDFSFFSRIIDGKLLQKTRNSIVKKVLLQDFTRIVSFSSSVASKELFLPVENAQNLAKKIQKLMKTKSNKTESRGTLSEFH